MELNLNGAAPVMSLQGLLEVKDGKGYRVTCRHGELWITEESDPRDIVLSPGKSFTIDRDGLTLVHAVERAGVVLRPPAQAGEPAAAAPAGSSPESGRPARQATAKFESNRTTFPKILPWIAREAGISDERAQALWREAVRHATVQIGWVGTADYYRAIMERLHELVGQEQRLTFKRRLSGVMK